MIARSLGLFVALSSLFLLILIAVLPFDQCLAMGPSLKTLPAAEAEVTGGYSLILYGGKYMTDVETVAVLVKDDNPFSFEPFAPDFAFKAKKGLSAGQAIIEAKEFVSMHPSFAGTIMSRVLDPQGSVIAYEVRALYTPVTYGVADVIDVDYVLRNDTVVMFVKAKRMVERSRDGGTERSSGGGDR